MRVMLTDDGSYSLDHQKAFDELQRTNGLGNANLTRTPIGDDCYEVTPDDAGLLGASK